MGLGDRIRHLARLNLDALLEGAPRARVLLDELTDEELEAELARRRSRRLREQSDRAELARAERAAQAHLGQARRAPARPRVPRRVPLRFDAVLARYYAELGLPYGADLTVVKRAYRRMMRSVHPDRHAGDAARHDEATLLSQTLGEAYRELERVLVQFERRDA